jgi:colanic acid biosynthesis protein WcaH
VLLSFSSQEMPSCSGPVLKTAGLPQTWSTSASGLVRTVGLLADAYMSNRRESNVQTYALKGWLEQADFSQAVDSLPLVSVDLVVTNASGEMLLGLRRNAPARQWWFTPGARVRKNETFAEAMERVMVSELGLQNIPILSQPLLMGVWDHFYEDSAFSEQVSTQYVNLPHLLRLNHSLDVHALPQDQHSNWRWQSPSIAASAQDVHPYVRVYAQWLVDNVIDAKPVW